MNNTKEIDLALTTKSQCSSRFTSISSTVLCNDSASLIPCSLDYKMSTLACKYIFDRESLVNSCVSTVHRQRLSVGTRVMRMGSWINSACCKTCEGKLNRQHLCPPKNRLGETSSSRCSRRPGRRVSSCPRPASFPARNICPAACRRTSSPVGDTVQ